MMSLVVNCIASSSIAVTTQETMRIGEGLRIYQIDSLVEHPSGSIDTEQRFLVLHVRMSATHDRLNVEPSLSRCTGESRRREMSPQRRSQQQRNIGASPFSTLELSVLVPNPSRDLPEGTAYLISFTCSVRRTWCCNPTAIIRGTQYELILPKSSMNSFR